MMISTQPSQFVKTSVPIVAGVSSSVNRGAQRTFHDRWLLKGDNGNVRDGYAVRDYYNDSYVVFDGYGGNISNIDERYGTQGKLGLIQKKLTMHSMSLSAINISADYDISGYNAYNVRRVKDITISPFYDYPNFTYVPLLDVKFSLNNTAFINSIKSWLKNNTGTPRPLVCSVRLHISWCMWGARKRFPPPYYDQTPYGGTGRFYAAVSNSNTPSGLSLGYLHSFYVYV